MAENPVTITFLVPPTLLRRVERIRKQREKESGGHIARSVVLREALIKLVESDTKPRRGAATGA